MSKAKKMTWREKQKKETRRVILDAAYTLFAEKGYEKTTMRALADCAGIGLGTIFNFFPDKPSLLVAAYLEDMGEVINEAFKFLPDNGIKSQLVFITLQIYKFYEKNPLFSRTLLKESIFLEGEHGEQLDAQLMGFMIQISELFKKAIERSELTSDTDPNEATLAYSSFYFSCLVMGLKQPKFNAVEQVKLVEGLIHNHFFKNR